MRAEDEIYFYCPCGEFTWDHGQMLCRACRGRVANETHWFWGRLLRLVLRLGNWINRKVRKNIEEN